MNRTRSTLGALMAAALLALSSSAANAQAVAYLRTSCAGQPTPCYSTLKSLFDWIVGTRKPNASSPLVVHMGAGTFTNGPGLNILGCAPGTAGAFHGYTTFLGAGTGVGGTTLQGIGGWNTTAALWVSGGCQALEFEDTKFQGLLYGVVWYSGGTTFGGGSSEWVNVEITATGSGGNAFGWYEEGLACVGAPPGTHTFYGSKVWVPNPGSTAAAYHAPCDANFYYGGEITALGTAQTSTGANLIAALVFKNGSLETYGTKVQALSDQAVNGGFDGSATDGVTAVVLGRNAGGASDPGGTFEAYAGEIIASAQTTAAQSAMGIDVGPGGLAESTGASLDVAPGTSGGTATTTRNAQAAAPVLQIRAAVEE